MKHIGHLIDLAYGGLERSVTPDDVAQDFIQNGYAKHVVGGLVATPKAQRYLLAQGHKPKAWQ